MDTREVRNTLLLSDAIFVDINSLKNILLASYE